MVGCIKAPAGHPALNELPVPSEPSSEPGENALAAPTEIDEPETAEEPGPDGEVPAPDEDEGAQVSEDDDAAADDAGAPAASGVEARPEESGAGASAEEWHGTVGAGSPASPVVREPRPSRPRGAATRPTRARSERADPLWTEIRSHDWGDEGLYPWASEIELTGGLLSRYTNRQLSIMAMEIYARRGKRFENAAWQRHFDRQDWYYPNMRYSEDWLGPIERGNTKLIVQNQRRRFGRPWTPPTDWDGAI